MPSGTIVLILGQSSLTAKGFQVLPGVIDEDYPGELEVIAQAFVIIQVLPETRIAQLLLLPYKAMGKVVTNEPQGNRAFGSFDAAFWIQAIKRTRPQMNLTIEGKLFKGLLDTRADVSVILQIHWPQAWPLQEVSTELQGVGHLQTPLQSTKIFKWQDAEGHSGWF